MIVVTLPVSRVQIDAFEDRLATEGLVQVQLARLTVD